MAMADEGNADLSKISEVCKFAVGYVPSPLHCGCPECCPALARAERRPRKSLVERLRTSWAVAAQVDLFQEAADEIERLRAAINAIDAQSISTTEPEYVAVPASVIAKALLAVPGGRKRDADAG